VDGKVVSMALMIAYGVNKAGSREILAVEPMFDESEDSWRAFFRKLKARGLQRICLCISDASLGIQAAVRKEWLGTSWQRCKVHFMRNILAKTMPPLKARASLDRSASRWNFALQIIRRPISWPFCISRYFFYFLKIKYSRSYNPLSYELLVFRILIFYYDVEGPVG